MQGFGEKQYAKFTFVKDVNIIMINVEIFGFSSASKDKEKSCKIQMQFIIGF